MFSSYSAPTGLGVARLPGNLLKPTRSAIFCRSVYVGRSGVSLVRQPGGLFLQRRGEAENKQRRPGGDAEPAFEREAFVCVLVGVMT